MAQEPQNYSIGLISNSQNTVGCFRTKMTAKYRNGINNSYAELLKCNSSNAGQTLNSQKTIIILPWQATYEAVYREYVSQKCTSATCIQ